MHDPREQFESSEKPSVPEWFVTFADMMSLLLALFVMLVSFSEIKEVERFEALSNSLRGQFGGAAKEMSPAAALAGRDLRLAGEINFARTRRAKLLGVDLPAAIAGSPDTTGTSVTGDTPGALNVSEPGESRAVRSAKLP
jgi:chemotaxis protein MotB